MCPFALIDAVYSLNVSEFISRPIPKLDFMQDQSGIYAKYPPASFGLILARAILEESFAALLRRSLPPDDAMPSSSAEPAGAWSNW